MVREGDVVLGDLRPGLASQFKMDYLKPGEVLRFSGSDIHGGPTEEGPRVLTLATWVLSPDDVQSVGLASRGAQHF